MAGLSPKTAFRAGTALPLLLFGLAFLPGCGPDAYPDDLTYQARTDPIVLKAPDTPIVQIDPPGHLDQWIAETPARGGKLLDPTAGIEKQQLARITEFLGKSHFDLTEDESREAGLASVPSKDTAKQDLESRRDALKKRIDEIEKKRQETEPALTKALADLFGTPAKPKVDLDDPVPLLDEATLAKGSSLYRRHCLHCHGLTGNGRGPTGPWVNPHPRDYRQGKFKFTSSAQSAGVRKPRREDLLRTLKEGIEGTSMPSFALLDEQTELEPLISYVIHLSLRGQVEMEMLEALLGSDSELTADDVPDEAAKKLARIWKTGWRDAEKEAIGVADAAPYTGKPLARLSPEQQTQLTESIHRGFVQFTTGTAQCRSCHNDFGRANDYKFDDWGTVVRPANLTSGIYRGGRRPLDLYYRIHSGITGANMPAFADSLAERYELTDASLAKLSHAAVPEGVLGKLNTVKGKQYFFKGGRTARENFLLDLRKTLDKAELERFQDLLVKEAYKRDEIWDIVNFLEAMPYPKMLPEDVRETIYGKR
jgi:mono/diheme cytochrome c family protein